MIKSIQIKKVGIICSLDKFANSIRATKIKRFLEKKGYNVKLINTYPVDKKSSRLLNTIWIIWKKIPSFLKNYALPLQFKLRANILSKIIKKEKFDIVMCENMLDSYIFIEDLNCLKILDSASPWIDELYYSGQLSDYVYKKLRKLELEIYKKSDYLSFHWNNYTKYVKKNVYNGKNLFILNWGCNPKPKEKLAEFSDKPKIIFLGYLEGYWVNLPLLSKLSKIYPIDVYGGPKPDKKWDLNYKGYAPSLDILSKYQFGLITITKDKLRKSSFSSKHLDYVSYGLPVLTPDWRKDTLLKKSSIYFNEQNFLKKVKEYSNKIGWQKKSKEAYKQAEKYNWSIVLRPLGKIIDEYSKIRNVQKNKI